MPIISMRALGAACAVGLGLGLAASPASAVTDYHSVSYSFNPPEYQWDGGGPVPDFSRASTGWFSGYSSRSYGADTYAPGFVAPTTGICGTDRGYSYDDEAGPIRAREWCDDVEQIRGGGVLPTVDASDNAVPTHVLPGDQLRVFGSDANDANAKPTVMTWTVEAPQPVIASPIGATTATIARSADSTSVSASLERRVARTVRREEFVPGSYHWVVVAGTPHDATLCTATVRDLGVPGGLPVTQSDVAPAQPTEPLAAGESYQLIRDSSCTTRNIAIAGAPYETVSYGRVIAVTPTAYTVQFDRPIAAGDMISYDQTKTIVGGDVTASQSVSNVVAAGTPAPADVTPPTMQKLDLGSLHPSVADFKKHGLLTFVTLSEAGTVTQTLQLETKQPKKKKKNKKTKASKKMTSKGAVKKPKTKQSKTKTKIVVLGSGSATTTADGQTARVLVKSTKAGRKALDKLKKGAPVKATLVTTIKDAAGNVVTSQQKVKLSGK